MSIESASEEFRKEMQNADSILKQHSGKCNDRPRSKSPMIICASILAIAIIAITAFT